MKSERWKLRNCFNVREEGKDGTEANDFLIIVNDSLINCSLEFVHRYSVRETNFEFPITDSYHIFLV